MVCVTAPAPVSVTVAVRSLVDVLRGTTTVMVCVVPPGTVAATLTGDTVSHDWLRLTVTFTVV